MPRPVRTCSPALALVLGALSLSADAFAQPAPKPAAPPPAAQAPLGQPAAKPGAQPPAAQAPAPAAAGAAAQLPPAPDVNDPMLDPLPRPRVEVGTWEEALQTLRARSTDLRMAAQDIVRAEAQARVALAGALTTINGTGAYTHNLITNETVQFLNTAGATQRVSTPFPDFVTGQLTLSQPVFAPRAWYAIGTAGRNEDIAHLSLEDTKRVISLAAANALVNVLLAERVAELNRLGLRNALTRLELATRKTALGSGTGLDVIRGRQDVETARATLVTGDEALRKTREALGLALGIPEQVGVPPNLNLNGLEASARNSCKALRDVNERPDIAALHGRVEVAHRAVNDVKYQFSPTVDFRSGVGTTTVNTGAAPNTTWNIQAVLTVPIWDGGIKYGNLRDTAAQERIAVEKLEAARRKAEVEVTQARRGVKVAEDQRTVALATRDLAAENDRLTRTAYLEGRGTSLELVTAAQALREAEIALARREFELVQARVLAVLALATCPW